MAEIKKKKAEINDVLSEQIKRKLMYTKQRYYEPGSKSAKLMAYKLKKQQSLRHVYKMKDHQTNSVVHKTEDIHKCFEFYYDKLYSGVHRDNDSQINNFLNSLE